MNNMTALVSCFVRAYHTENSNIKVYNDAFASKILTKEEYFRIINNKPDEEFLKECKEVVKLFKGDGDNEH